MLVLFDPSNVYLFSIETRQLMAIGERKGNLYYLSANAAHYLNQLNSLALSNAASEPIWHARMGHINNERLRLLFSGSASGAIKKGNNKQTFCESCIHGKGTRTPFRSQAKTEHRANEVLGRVSTDLCGPLPPSLDGEVYFMAVLDQYSHYIKVYFLTNKSEGFERYQQYAQYCRSFHNKNIKTLRIDGGGEFNSNSFLQYLRDHGTTLERTMPHSSQENGSSERINRTLADTARCLMHYANIPTQFWAYAIQFAAYILNRTPTKCVADHRTPFEIWHGYQPDLSKMRTFGCSAYNIIPKQNQLHKLSKYQSQ